MLFVSCGNSKKNQDDKTVYHVDTLQLDSSRTTIQIDENAKKNPKKMDPVLGNIISGDFDGDGKKERLVEYSSGFDIDSFYDSSTDYDQLVTLTEKKNLYSFVISDNKCIDTLHINSGGEILGLFYLKNEGDLNGDGTDEVSYVIDWADCGQH